ncbi:hypothetical protein AAHC03_09890 [Spirometra sp. Aus1]
MVLNAQKVVGTTSEHLPSLDSLEQQGECIPLPHKTPPTSGGRNSTTDRWPNQSALVGRAESGAEEWFSYQQRD